MWRFESALNDGDRTKAGFDRLFMLREGRVTAGLDIHDIAMAAQLLARSQTPCCGFVIIDLDTEKTVEWLLFQHTINELYDVAVMPDVVQPELIGFDAIEHIERMTKIQV